MLKSDVRKEPREPRSGKMIGFLPTEALRTELEQVAEFEQRSLSDTCYRLVLKGLDAYQKDRDLRSPRNLPFKKSK